MMGTDYYPEVLNPLYAGRRWIICVDVAAGAIALAQRLIDAGAKTVIVIAGSEGTGAQPSDDVEVFLTGATGKTMMDIVRAVTAAITTPSQELRAAIDMFDPKGEAMVFANYLIPVTEVCGRSVHGAPRPEWRVLEDKLIIDELWDRAGVERSPSVIVDVSREAAVHRALRDLASTDGAVAVADNTE